MSCCCWKVFSDLDILLCLQIFLECAIEAESSQNSLESKLLDLACDLVKGLVLVASLNKN